MNNMLTIAISDPTKAFDLKEIKLLTGLDIEPLLASENAIAKAIETHYETNHAAELRKFMDGMGLVVMHRWRLLRKKKGRYYQARV